MSGIDWSEYIEPQGTPDSFEQYALERKLNPPARETQPFLACTDDDAEERQEAA